MAIDHDEDDDATNVTESSQPFIQLRTQLTVLGEFCTDYIHLVSMSKDCKRSVLGS